MYTEQAKLVGSGTLFNSGQGFSTALSDDGNTMVTGAIQDVNQLFGGVWVFVRDGLGNWTQEQKLSSTVQNGAPAFNNMFLSVAIAGDGNTVAVGAPYSPTVAHLGHVAVWTRTAGVWTEEAISLVGVPNATTGETLEGFSVALSQDGNTLAIGAPFNEQAPGDQSGAVYVFTRTAGVWTQESGALIGSGIIGLTSEQGSSVALSDDGNTLLTGAPLDGLAFSNEGAAWVWTRTAGVWTEQQKLFSPNFVFGARQGYSVALSGDGDTALIGGPDDNAAWIWTRTAGVWTEGQKLTDQPGGPQAFGLAVALANDASFAVVGAPDFSVVTGNAFVFLRSGAVWTSVQMLTPAVVIQPTQGESVIFGTSVAISRDMLTLSIGGPNDGKDFALGIGALWIFTGSPSPPPPSAPAMLFLNANAFSPVILPDPTKGSCN